MQNHEQKMHETEILYEISLSIGRTLELNAMLKQSVGTLMRLCNCNAASVLYFQAKDGNDEQLIGPETCIQWNSVYAMPKNIIKKSEYLNFVDSLKLPATVADLSNWTQSLPITSPRENLIFYAFNLPEFGVLLLQRIGEPMPEQFMLSLQKLMDKLAYSAKACLYESELKNQMEAVQAASVAKSRFLANMSHEIRTPMNGILGMLDIVLESRLQKDQQEYLRLAKLSAQHLLGIINQVLDISKIEANKIDLHEESIDLINFIGRVIQTQAPLALSKEISLNYNIAENLPHYVKADPVRLQQILVNLLGNALKFTEQGSVTLTVESEPSSDPAQRIVKFSVIDTGIGIPEDKHKQIFEAFEQADVGRSRKYEGTGLGLAITRQLIEMMHGRITVDSELGKGSTFTLKLPLHMTTVQETADALDEIDYQVGKILFVDDEAINRNVFSAMMKIIGLPYKICNSGSEAIFHLKLAHEQKQPFDMVFMDAYMPGMDGYTTAEQIITQGFLTSRQIVILTSSALRGEFEKCKGLGLAGYLTKPIALNDLREVLNKPKGNNTALQDTSTEEVSGVAKRPLKILLAEDNMINQMVALKLLEKIGAKCTVANNGEEAVKLTMNKSFDLVLMDIMMPVMDGIEATKQIRRYEKERSLPTLPIIALTANTMKGDKEFYLSEGVQGYVAKPIEPHLLFAEIERILAIGTPSEKKDFHIVLNRFDDLLALTDDEETDTFADETSYQIKCDASSTHVSPEEAKEDITHSILDWERAVKQLGGEEDILFQAIELFSSSALHELEQMQQNLRNHDIESLKIQAHTLKGQCATFCANDAREAALQMELLCKQEADATQLAAGMEALEKQLKALLPVMESKLRSSS